MKITIEPETEKEKADPRITRVVLTSMAGIALAGIPAENLEEMAFYLHFRDNLPLLQQRVSELTFQLMKARLIAEAAQAQQQSRIQVAQPNIPFAGGNDRRLR